MAFVKAIATRTNASFVMASWRRDYAGDCNSPHPWFEPRARPPFLPFCAVTGVTTVRERMSDRKQRDALSSQSSSSIKGSMASGV